MNLAVEREHQAHGELGDGVGRWTSTRTTVMPNSLAGGEIDIVEARTAEGHQPDAGQCEGLEHNAIEPILDKHADGVEPVTIGTVSIFSRGAKYES